MRKNTNESNFKMFDSEFHVVFKQFLFVKIDNNVENLQCYIEDVSDKGL